MKMKLGLLLLVAGLALVGMVAAISDPDIPEYSFNAWEAFGLENLAAQTPAFGSSWVYSYGNAAPTASWIKEWQTPGSNEWKDPFTFTFTEANVKDTAYNLRIDPKATAGGDGVAVAAFGAANSCFPGLNEPPYWVLANKDQTFVEPFPMAGLSPALDNVAIAQTKGDVDVQMAIDNAWAHFASENTAFADDMSSESRSWSVGTAIADFGWQD